MPPPPSPVSVLTGFDCFASKHKRLTADFCVLFIGMPREKCCTIIFEQVPSKKFSFGLSKILTIQFVVKSLLCKLNV